MNRTRLTVTVIAAAMLTVGVTSATVLALDSDPAAAADVQSRPATVSVRGTGVAAASPTCCG